MTAQSPSGPTRSAKALGYGGLIPFVGLAVAIWSLPPGGRGDPATGPSAALALAALLAYGATIVAFLGAVHWGFAMRQTSGSTTNLLLWGVTPSLLAWVAMLFGPPVGLWLIAAGLWLCFWVDRRIYPQFGLGAWLPMRALLTVVASVACMAAAMR